MSQLDDPLGHKPPLFNCMRCVWRCRRNFLVPCALVCAVRAAPSRGKGTLPFTPLMGYGIMETVPDQREEGPKCNLLSRKTLPTVKVIVTYCQDWCYVLSSLARSPPLRGHDAVTAFDLLDYAQVVFRHIFKLAARPGQPDASVHAFYNAGVEQLDQIRYL